MGTDKTDKTSLALSKFDYSRVSANDATDLRETAERVRQRHRQQIAAIIETGRELSAVKAKLEHGQFGRWIAAEFDWSERTAQNYMSAFEAFGDKTATVADLPPTAVYQLASAPAQIREKVLQRREAEGAAPDAVRGILSEEIKADKAAQAEAKKAPAVRQKEKARLARIRREQEKQRAEWAARDTARQAAMTKLALLLLDIAGERVDELKQALANTDFFALGHWLEMPHGWEYHASGGYRLPNPPPPTMPASRPAGIAERER